MRNENLPTAGQTLGMTLHVVLLLLVLGQVVFLASRFRARIDLTSDGLYTLTESTSRVIEGLERRLLIEAYFSPDDTVPPDYRECRPNIRNFLDELVEVGNGMVIVQELNPLDDKELADKARRLGIRPANTQEQTAGKVSIQELWQGLRIRYGAERQKIIEFISPQYSLPTQLELTITPAIKEVTVEERTKIGFMEWQFEPAVTIGPTLVEERPQGWFQVRNMQQIQGRYAFFNLRYADTLVPDDMETLLLFRPKGLSDREKYIIDQFLMQGKRLVVFADTMDYSIGQSRRFVNREFAFDAPGSEVKFLDQLAHYGVRVQEALVADMSSPSQGQLGLRRVMGNLGGMAQIYPLPWYPYFFRPLDIDWADYAASLAGGNPTVEERYRQVFKPGITKSNALTQTMAMVLNQPTGGPEFFWASPVEVVAGLPAGLVGEELLFTSPLTLVIDPPPNTTAPMNFAGSSDVQEANYAQFVEGLSSQLRSEPRRQVSVMASVTGRFTSAFEGKAIPKALGEVEAVKVVDDPLEGPIKDDPLAERTGDEVKPGEAQEGGDANASGQDPEAELAGPPVPAPDELAVDDGEPDPVFRAVKDGQLVVIGDSDFLRDDLVGRPAQPQGDYANIGGPVSRTGRLFFVSLLDWLHQEEDLRAITDRNLEIRTLTFAQQDLQQERIEDFRERLSAKTGRVQWLNILLPPLLLVGFGLVLASMRHAHKRSFLTSTQS